jgi:hypothetical protein
MRTARRWKLDSFTRAANRQATIPLPALAIVPALQQSGICQTCIVALARPSSAGRPWTPADDAQLLALLDLKMDRALIARKLKRTVSAIGRRSRTLNKRLVELGLKKGN